MDIETRTKADSHNVSTGAGIAIAGIWVAGAALTIVMLLIVFVWSEPMSDDDMKKLGVWGLIVGGLILASPMIAAYSITKVILGRD